MIIHKGYILSSLPGQGNVKGRSGLQMAFYPDSSLMHFYDFLYDRKVLLFWIELIAFQTGLFQDTSKLLIEYKLTGTDPAARRVFLRDLKWIKLSLAAVGWIS
jgi:hypothetical protein